MAESSRPALSTLRGVFPSWDVKALEQVLAAHDGDIDSTVHALLAMDAVPRTDESQAPQSVPANDQVPAALSHHERSPAPPPAAAAAATSMRKHPRRRVQLPADFLRLPTDGGRVVSEQEERDAVLARMLQDQLFRDEVFSSHEFSSHFHDGRPMWPLRPYAPDKSATELASQTYTAMRGTFTSMSEVMKDKMYDMYTRFQMRNDSAFSSDPKSTRSLMASDSESSENEDADLSVQDHNMDSHRGQECARRRSLHDVTDESSAGTDPCSKKDL
ncbi:unnamed protein product [Hyaloperonospora brassicae]|uniref:CUE domain-containing protein n=1 Tax=Hyaloperonospora brassicae TaxID=162125 RepID=A0AAV0USW7_HYABA|nr:unnamed protein product [Hyaloperonospora brassicae]